MADESVPDEVKADIRRLQHNAEGHMSARRQAAEQEQKQSRNTKRTKSKRN